MGNDDFEFEWCEEHQRPCDELYEDSEGREYYDCPECKWEESNDGFYDAIYGAPPKGDQ